MKFYVGLHQPCDSRHFERAFISINRVRTRKAPVPCREWIMDSGAFSEIRQHGRYRYPPEVYAGEINAIAGKNPGLFAAVSQDYMCEPVMLQRTGLTIADHQRLTIERYDILRALTAVQLIPVLQGYDVESYLRHIEQYGRRLSSGMLVGVGSVCKRNTDIGEIKRILLSIRQKRPFLRLHGFGLKTTALTSGVVRAVLESADSMAWSFAARREGRNRNSWREAMAFAQKIETTEPYQMG